MAESYHSHKTSDADTDTRGASADSELPDDPTGFGRLGLGPATLAAVRDMGYGTPTPIQAWSIPLFYFYFRITKKSQIANFSWQSLYTEVTSVPGCKIPSSKFLPSL